MLALVLVLPGCGYQPVRPVHIAPELQPVYVRDNSALGIAIKRQLKAAVIALAITSAEAASSLQLINTQMNSRGQTVSLTGRDAEMLRQLQATVIWQTANGKVLLEQQLDAETLQIANPDNPLAEYNERDTIENNLTQALTQQVLRMLRTVDPAELR